MPVQLYYMDCKKRIDLTQPSVRLSVTDVYVLWLTCDNFYTNNFPCVLNLGMQNFSDLVQKEHFSVRGWTEEG